MIINMNGAKAPETPSPVLQEKTVTPETLPTVIGADEGYDGLSQVTVNPDAQLKAENIRSGKTIFGVTGSFVGETQYTDTLDMDDFAPFSYMAGSGYYGQIYELYSQQDVPREVNILEYSYPSGGVAINYGKYVIVSDYKGSTYLICSDGTGGFQTNSYIPSASYQWFKFSVNIPAGNVSFWASDYNKKMHVTGDFVAFIRLFGTPTLADNLCVTNVSDYVQTKVHVDADTYQNTGGRWVFDVDFPETTFTMWGFSYSSDTITEKSARLYLIPIKVKFT